MSQVINRNNYSSQRSTYLRFISTALNYLKSKNISKDEYKDIVVFIFLTMGEIEKTIQQTIQPWEKRGYWVKADQFRNEWSWVEPLYHSMKTKIEAQNWEKMRTDLQAIDEICEDYPPYQRMQIKNPWQGSWQKWNMNKKRAG